MALRRADTCFTCATPLPAGTRATWDPVAKTVTCLACPAATASAAPRDAARTAVHEPPPIDVGDPGRSARQEHDRRHAKREAQIEQKWGTGRMGKIAKRLSDDPQTTKAWAAGASGEERVAQVLHDRLGDQAVLLHDRKVPGTRGNIDHLAIAASGVWVIDAKKYQGKVEQRDVGGWFKTDLRLYVGGRDRTKTVTDLAWQIEAVTKALGTEKPSIQAALSFVGAEWPIFFAKPLRLDEVWISWPTKLADLIATEGPLGPEDIDRIARLLSARLPSK
ncbi:MAG: hypothetical protein JWO77_3548 [Ilumatobacteraceae bacterium]|nr:hypothetical protein [Ilumatobacteraceae bacterium]